MSDLITGRRIGVALAGISELLGVVRFRDESGPVVLRVTCN